MAPAFEHVDSSSGALGAALSSAIDDLVEIFHAAPLSERRRHKLLERIWHAFLDDEIPYIESLEDHWGALCATDAIASAWADRIADFTRVVRSTDAKQRGYVKGEIALLSVLFRTRRYAELMRIIDDHGSRFWPYRQWGFRVLVEQGKPDEAVGYAEASDYGQMYTVHIARASEDLLRSLGRSAEAYERFALDAIGYRPTYLARYKALATKYPEVEPSRLLHDLIARSPG